MRYQLRRYEPIPVSTRLAQALAGSDRLTELQAWMARSEYRQLLRHVPYDTVRRMKRLYVLLEFIQDLNNEEILQLNNQLKSLGVDLAKGNWTVK